MDRSTAIWVSEVPEKWVPKLYEDYASESSDSESDSETDPNDSYENMEEVEDFEEGESRNDGSQIQAPEGKDDIPVVDSPVDEVQEP
ncbi:hypothetical protein Hanom_Chr04g00384021 [Helianthus anomalus]